MNQQTPREPCGCQVRLVRWLHHPTRMFFQELMKKMVLNVLNVCARLEALKDSQRLLLLL